jgi:DNA primase
MSSYNSSLEDIKNRLNIIDVISEYLSLKKAGQNWKGLCPFHSEKTPSFTVSPSKQIYHCFGCSSGGDIFSFLMKHENISFAEALGILAKKAGVTIKKTQKNNAASGAKEQLVLLHKDACVFYQQSLKRSSKARAYLKKRGIDDETQNLFSIGYAPDRWDALLIHLKNKKYDIEIMKKAGLIVHGTKGFYDTFRNRIVFPIFDLRGDIIAFGGRVLDNSVPKYLNSPETPIFNKSRVLYGLNRAKEPIRKKGEAIIVEGYLDVIRVHMHGFDNAVAPLGTAFTPEHGQLLKRLTQDVVLVFDGDASGIKAAKNGISILLERGFNVKVLEMPDGEDPDSLLKENGKEAFSSLLEHAASIVDFFVRLGGSTADRKNDAHVTARESLEAICKIPDSVLQGFHVKQLSERLHINELFIREQLMNIRGKDRSRATHARGRAVSSEIIHKARPLDELYVLQLVLQMPEMTDNIFHDINEDDFGDPVARSIFIKMKGGLISYNALVSECDEPERNLLSDLYLRDGFEEPEKILQDCAKRLKSKKRQSLLQELQHKIRIAEREKNDSLLKTLLIEKQRQLKSKG